MSKSPTNLFWDTCVFSALLYDEKETYDIPSIEQFLSDARDGGYKIHTSSIIFAEIASSKIKRKKTGTITDLINDLLGSVVVIDASVIVFKIAGRLKDIKYRKGQSDKRFLSTGDAVMLASVIYIEDILEVKIDTFHTFDNAKKKQIPLLTYHEWCEGLSGENATLADRICKIKREKPIHPTPRLPGT